MAKYSYEDVRLMTKNDIALMSKTELESSGFNNNLRRYILDEILKIGCAGLSRKDDLVERIYESTNVLRSAIINREAELIENKKRDKALKSAKKSEKAKTMRDRQEDGERFIDGKSIFNRFKEKSKETKKDEFTYPTPSKLSSWVLAEYLAVKYSANYILADKSTEFYNALDELETITLIEADYKEQIKQAWHDLIRPYREAKWAREKAILAEKHKGNNKQLSGNTKAIIDWAIATIKTPPKKPVEVVYQGYAFAVLTGRRLMEIFGTETTYSLSNERYIYVENLLKGSQDTMIVTLVDDAKFLVDFINSYEKKTYDLSKEKTVSSYVSKAHRKPKELVELGIKTFKDCRDFYASAVKTTFDSIDGRGDAFTQVVMGHSNAETTKYYANFKIEPVENLEQLFKEYMNINATRLASEADKLMSQADSNVREKLNK